MNETRSDKAEKAKTPKWPTRSKKMTQEIDNAEKDHKHKNPVLSHLNEAGE